MGFYEVVIEGRQSGADMLNVFHYEAPDGQTLDWQAGADEIRSHLANRLQPLCGPQITWQGITVRLDEVGQVGVNYPFTLGPLAGTNPDGDQVYQASVLIRKRSLAGIKPVLGWFFQGGITVRGTTAFGVWEETIADEVELYAEDIRTLGAVATTPVTMAIKARNPTAPNTQPYTLVDVVERDLQVHTVRSRARNTGS